MSNKLENAVRLLFSPEYRHHRRLFRAEYRDLARLGAMPRYQSGQTVLRGHKVYFPDAASYLFTRTEIFDKEIYNFDSATPAPYIIDGGANIGLASIYLKLKYPGARIVAFEPDSSIADFYRKNVASFGFADVELVQKGLWSFDGNLEFASEGADGGSFIADEAGKHKTISIPVTRLSAYMGKKVDFLKIDIEGAELEVLEECRAGLPNVERIFVEYHSFEGKPQHLARLIAILEEAGFRLHINAPGLSSTQPLKGRIVYNGMDMQLNVYGFRD